MDVEKDVLFDCYTIVLDPEENNDEDILMDESLGLTNNKSSLKIQRQQSMHNSSSVFPIDSCLLVSHFDSTKVLKIQC